MFNNAVMEEAGDAASEASVSSSRLNAHADAVMTLGNERATLYLAKQQSKGEKVRKSLMNKKTDIAKVVFTWMDKDGIVLCVSFVPKMHRCTEFQSVKKSLNAKFGRAQGDIYFVTFIARDPVGRRQVVLFSASTLKMFCLELRMQTAWAAGYQHPATIVEDFPQEDVTVMERVQKRMVLFVERPKPEVLQDIQNNWDADMVKNMIRYRSNMYEARRVDMWAKKGELFLQRAYGEMHDTLRKRSLDVMEEEPDSKSEAEKKKKKKEDLDSDSFSSSSSSSGSSGSEVAPASELPQSDAPEPAPAPASVV